MQYRMVVLVIQHPGMVWTTLDTRAAGGTKGMQLDEVARKLLGASVSQVDTGRSWHREGQELPWVCGELATRCGLATSLQNMIECCQ